jgi:hypothetical protein
VKFTREISPFFLFIFTCISCGYKDKEPVVRKGRFWFFLPVYGFEGGVFYSHPDIRSLVCAWRFFTFMALFNNFTQ